jgi:hypothetical protein
VGARSRFKCNAAVLVLAPEADVAAWARRPIVLGPDNVFKPLVVGSDVVPVVRSVEQARGAPELAVLSAKAHGTDAVVGAEVGFAAAVAAAGLPAERAALYWDVVMASLNAATRVALEEMMTSGHYEYQSDFAKKYFSEGKVEGKADALLRILAARDLVVSAAERAQIVACTDLERLDGWIERAVHASTTADVLAER